MRKFACCMLISLANTAAADDLASHAAGIWSIAPTQDMQRWIVIHNLGSARADGIYHIEVLGRKNGDPVWAIVHLVEHMAITEKALNASITKPLSRGAVYPETYEYAYDQWKKANDGRGGGVCNSSVIACM